MKSKSEAEPKLLMKILKSKWTLLAVGIFFVWGIGYGMGNTSAKIPLKDEKVTYDELVSKIEDLEIELTAAEKDKESVLDEIGSHQEEFDKAMKVSKNKEKLLSEISKHEKEIATKKTDLETLKVDILLKNTELESIDKLIVEKEEEPISLSAGTYIIGEDVPAGRYKAVPVGKGSNFTTFDPDGRLDVNTILGAHGEAEYIFFALDGGVIESNSTANLIPVE